MGVLLLIIIVVVPLVLSLWWKNMSASQMRKQVPYWEVGDELCIDHAKNKRFWLQKWDRMGNFTAKDAQGKLHSFISDGIHIQNLSLEIRNIEKDFKQIKKNTPTPENPEKNTQNSPNYANGTKKDD